MSVPAAGKGSVAAWVRSFPGRGLDDRWTGGKTRTRRLTRDEAKLYTEWIGNDRRLRKVIQ